MKSTMMSVLLHHLSIGIIDSTDPSPARASHEFGVIKDFPGLGFILAGGHDPEIHHANVELYQLILSFCWTRAALYRTTVQYLPCSLSGRYRVHRPGRRPSAVFSIASSIVK